MREDRDCGIPAPERSNTSFAPAGVWQEGTAEAALERVLATRALRMAPVCTTTLAGRVMLAKPWQPR